MQQQTSGNRSSGRPAIELDWSKFNRSLVMPVTHHLARHPLLQRPALIELDRRLAEKRGIRRHAMEAEASMSLLNVQSDGLYRTLVDEALDSVKPGIERFDPGMCYRGGWIFGTPPRMVTPFHLRSEHDFILQIQGRKRIYVWDPSDTVVISERAREAFHATQSRDLIKWQQEFKERAHKFDLEPGQGAYVPSTSPHLVENGDDPSITASFTYYTDFTRRQSLLYATRDQLRRLGLDPPGVGALPALDEALHATISRFRSGKDAFRQALGRRVHRSDAPYALAR